MNNYKKFKATEKEYKEYKEACEAYDKAAASFNDAFVMRESLKAAFLAAMKDRDVLDGYDASYLYNADPNCKHEVVGLMSGVKCRKCSGWFCS